MKLFSRKALAAVATTFALTTAGMSAPAFAADAPETGIVQQIAGLSSDEGTDYQNNNGGRNNNSDGSADASSDPAELRSWVAVVTAVIGALSTAFNFLQVLNPTA